MRTWDEDEKIFKRIVKPTYKTISIGIPKHALMDTVDKVPGIHYSKATMDNDQYDRVYKTGYEKGVDDYDKALTPARIIYNPPATIVFWANGEKTVVKCSETETFNKYHGFCAALAKRIVGNNSQLTKLVNSGFLEHSICKDSKKKDQKPKKSDNKKSKETKKK